MVQAAGPHQRHEGTARHASHPGAQPTSEDLWFHRRCSRPRRLRPLHVLLLNIVSDSSRTVRHLSAGGQELAAPFLRSAGHDGAREEPAWSCVDGRVPTRFATDPTEFPMIPQPAAARSGGSVDAPTTPKPAPGALDSEGIVRFVGLGGSLPMAPTRVGGSGLGHSPDETGRQGGRT